MDVEKKAEKFRENFSKLKSEIEKVIVGGSGIVESVLIALFAGGHCLLEGAPGLGKTLLIKTLSQTLDLSFSRIQFTPDLMPADIIGTNMIVEDERGRREFRFQPGPIFGNMILADEINRATPKTQSALLEAMQEHTVSIARKIHKLESPFFVMATQNPIEMEGTYSLPEAQLDRFFFKILVDYPDRSDLQTILERTTQKEIPQAGKIIDGSSIVEWQNFIREVAVAPQVSDYAARLIIATQPNKENPIEMVNKYVRYGSSPRGAQALLLAGKVIALQSEQYNVSFDGIKQAALPALRHRILLNFEAQADGITSDQIVNEILDKTESKTN